MAPTTRASAHVFQTKNKKKGNSEKKPLSTGKANSKQKKPDKQETRCRLLELPPELRNRIYHFSQEDVFEWDPFALNPPRLSRGITPKRPLLSYSSRKFFALTQSCKQVREEFRPLWLRQSSIRIEVDDVGKFVTDFYPKIADYKHAPKLLVINWNHDNYDDVLISLKPLIKLRAHCSTFVVKFGCHKMVHCELPEVHCDDCGHSTHCGCLTDCDHEAAIDDAMTELTFQYAYTELLDSFLANNNESWLKAIRDDKAGDIEVEFAVDLVDISQIGTAKPVIFIRFAPHSAPSMFKKKDIYNSALKYLKKMGMFDLESRHLPDFVVGESTGKFTRALEGCQHASPLYNQVHICGHVGEDLRSTS